MKRRLLFLVGPDRSGANLLAWSLAQHPGVAGVLHDGWFRHLCTAVRRLDERGLLGAGHVPRGGFAPTNRAPVNEETVAFLERLMPAAPSPEARWWIDCSPNSPEAVQELVPFFPDLRTIHVVRDVGAAVYVWDRNLTQWGLRNTAGDPYEQWLAAVRAGLALEEGLGPEAALRVSYDELVESPGEALRRCLDLLGEPFDPACLRPLRGGRPPSPPFAADDSRWARSPHRQEAETLARALLGATRTAPELAPGRSIFTSALHEAVRRVAPPGSRILVVTEGDDELVRIDGRVAVGFPKIDTGPQPSDSAEAIAHLEELRARGANFLVVPAPSRSWLEHYGGLRRYLEERFEDAFEITGVCTVYPLVEMPFAELARASLHSGIREILAHAAPPGGRILVVSKGDEELVRLDCGQVGMHFPQADGGIYAGYHPTDSAEAIAHLEELREQGAEFIAFPAPSSWWLGFYKELRTHLESRYRLAGRHDECVVFDLREPGPRPASAPSVVGDLHQAVKRAAAPEQPAEPARASFSRAFRKALAGTLPEDARVLVVSKGDEELVRLDRGQIGMHFPQTDGGIYAGYHPADSAEAIAHLEELRGRGAEFIVFPRPSSWWLEFYAEFRAHLEGRYRIAARGEECVVFDLRDGPSPNAKGSRGSRKRAKSALRLRRRGDR